MRYTLGMAYTTLLVDLDDTVYPAGNGLWEAIALRIERYMHERLSVPLEQIPALRHELHARFGTTLRGLAETRQVDELDYLAYVHDIPLTNYLAPDPDVRAALQANPLRKAIFTNADQAHAGRVLNILGLQDLFEQIIDINAIRPYCKPMPQAYRIALDLLASQPQECVFLDDSLNNLSAARQMGITPVYINRPPPAYPGIFWLSTLANLQELDELLKLQSGKSGSHSSPFNRTVLP
jgi:putative hydrolase of the HAD superfamily